MLVITGLAQVRILVSGIVIRPNPLTAALTAGCLCVQAAGAEIGIIKFRQFLYWV
jgi:hypothetical protein